MLAFITNVFIFKTLSFISDIEVILTFGLNIVYLSALIHSCIIAAKLVVINDK